MSCGQVSLPPAPEGNLGLTSTTTDLDEGTRGFVKVNEFFFNPMRQTKDFQEK
jgi:hypothetical protein